jgi:hypothetical protein
MRPVAVTWVGGSSLFSGSICSAVGISTCISWYTTAAALAVSLGAADSNAVPARSSRRLTTCDLQAPRGATWARLPAALLPVQTLACRCNRPACAMLRLVCLPRR